MGQRYCPRGRRVSACFARRALSLAGAWTPPAPKKYAHALLVAFALACLSLAYGLPSRALAAAPNTPPGLDQNKMFVEADELVNNKDNNTVSAQGNVRIYYKGRILEADRVIFNRTTKRLVATGHAKLSEPDGTIMHAQSFDLTQDFADGFIESLRTDTPDKTYLSAPRAERIGGNITVFDKGTYTACETCKNDPQRPPLWRVRAMRIIHNKDEHMVYYTNAWFEFAGIPIAYFPFLSSPDPTVRRKSGVLTPNYMQNLYLGNGFQLPIFWALAPNYDVTFTPTYWTKQGFFGDIVWRHRLPSGSYIVRANGIMQQDPGTFAQPPYGAADRIWRGEFESKGDFLLAPKWNIGWDFALLSDKWYVNDYLVGTQAATSYYISDVTSTAYLTGQGNRSYFDLRGFYFQGLASHDYQPEQPIAHPVMDYNRTFDLDPARTHGIGGQVELDVDFTSLTETAASYQSVGMHLYDAAYGLYDICKTYMPGTTSTSCLLHGIGGNYNRLAADVSWKRQYIDPIGEVWTPFVFSRFSGEWLDLNTSNTYTFSSGSGTSTFSNASQTNFGLSSGAFGYVMPGAGAEWRYPFVTRVPFGSFEIEPIGQVIARPNSVLGTNTLVNMDSQSLVFDTTNLFAWDKYSGYDRFETGLRANYGAQATFKLNTGGYVNVMAGQSVQLAGTNSYATPDAANIGLSSGLDRPWSNYVASFTVVPSSLLSFTAQGQFDQATLDVKRVDVVTNFNLGAWTSGIQYANYASQPLIGFPVRREGLALNSRYAITKDYFISGSVAFDMSRQFYQPPLVSVNSGPFSISSFNVVGGYKDDCTTVQLSYTNAYIDNGQGSFNHDETFLLTIQLRTLGDTHFSQNFIATPTGTVSQ